MRTRAICMAVIVPFAVLARATDVPVAGRSALPGIGARQASLVVNMTSDSDDRACHASHCSLQQAITVADSSSGRDTISFNIPFGRPGCNSGGVCTIRPTTALPSVTDAWTTINGYSQPGASPHSSPFGEGMNAAYKIVLDGSALPCSAAIELRSSGNLVRGLVIQRFYNRVSVMDADDNRIEGNFIGTDALGASAAGNLCDGVSINGIQGGPDPATTCLAAVVHRRAI